MTALSSATAAHITASATSENTTTFEGTKIVVGAIQDIPGLASEVKAKFPQNAHGFFIAVLDKGSRGPYFYLEESMEMAKIISSEIPVYLSEAKYC